MKNDELFPKRRTRSSSEKFIWTWEELLIVERIRPSESKVLAVPTKIVENIEFDFYAYLRRKTIVKRNMRSSSKAPRVHLKFPDEISRRYWPSSAKLICRQVPRSAGAKSSFWEELMPNAVLWCRVLLARPHFFFMSFSETVSTVCDFQKLLACKSSIQENYELAHRDEVAFRKELFDSIRFPLNLFVETVCISSWKPWGVAIYDNMWPHMSICRKAQKKLIRSKKKMSFLFFSPDSRSFFREGFRKSSSFWKWDLIGENKKMFSKRLGFKSTCDI